MTLSIMTVSITSLSIMTLSIMTLSITSLSIMTLVESLSKNLFGIEQHVLDTNAGKQLT
jgi:hypothetical protein